MTKLKLLRVRPEDKEFALILKDISNEDKLPYIFQVGDTIEITDNGTINTIRRGGLPDYISKSLVQGDHFSKEWLEQRVTELNFKIKQAIFNGHFISQADMHERNYLLEIKKELEKYELQNTETTDD